MNQVEVWIKLLFTYGPFALLVFFVFIAENKARNAMKEANGDNRKPMIVIYVANWVVIFALVAFAVYAWQLTNLRSEYVIRGKLENLHASETIVARNRELYLSRIYLPTGHIDYKWRLITKAPLPNGTKIPLFFQRTERLDDDNVDLVTIYELTILPDFYEKEVYVKYRRRDHKLVLVHDNTETELPAKNSENDTKPERAHGFFLRAAHAADLPVDLQERLEANDPIVRYDARRALERAGNRALPWIQAALSAPNPSYRVQLAAILALSKLEDLSVDDMAPGAIDRIIKACTHADSTLRGHARRFLVKHRSASLVEALQHHLGVLAAGGDPRQNQMLERLALVQLDVLYNLGIDEKDRYGSRHPEDQERIHAAMADFERAWGLRHYAPPERRALFAKALYGWGHALHDRSWIEREPDGLRNPTLVRAAQDKFKEYLAALEEMPDAKAYPYPNHITSAHAYIDNPEPSSLTAKYFVIAGSFKKPERDRAETQLAALTGNGFNAQISDTDLYPNLRNGLWAVTLGPYSHERAQEIKQRVMTIVPDAYVKAGW